MNTQAPDNRHRLSLLLNIEQYHYMHVLIDSVFFPFPRWYQDPEIIWFKVNALANVIAQPEWLTVTRYRELEAQGW
jgi:hypothetical protein